MAKASKSNHSRLLGLFAIFVIAAAIALTVIISQQQTQTKQEAAVAIDTPFPATFGDVDCDGSITSRDSQAILRIVTGQTPMAKIQTAVRCYPIGAKVIIDKVIRIWGDVDCDESVTSRDSQAILRATLKQKPLSQYGSLCPKLGDIVQVQVQSPSPIPSVGKPWSVTPYPTKVPYYPTKAPYLPTPTPVSLK